MSHFRSSTLAWDQDDSNLYLFTFTGQQSWRTTSTYSVSTGGSASGAQITVGMIVSNSDTLNFGDGGTARIWLKVLSVNSTGDYFVAELVNQDGSAITHTYSSAAPANYEAFYQSSARITTNDAFSNGGYRSETLVNAGVANEAPVSAVPPIVQVADNAIFTYQLAATDPNGDQLRFRIGNASEFIGSTSSAATLVAPAGVTVSDSGLLTWDIRDSVAGSVAVGNKYTMTVMVSDGKTNTPIDFIFEIVDTASNQAPTFTSVPPTQNLGVGQTVNLAVEATDPNGNLTNIQVLNPPPGMTTEYHSSHGELHIDFTPSTGGNYVVTVQATDAGGLTTSTSITFNVTSNTPPVAVDDGVTVLEDGSLTIPAADLLGNDTDADTNPLTIQSVGNATNGTVVLNGDGSVTFTPTGNFSGAASFEYVVSDGQGGTDTGLVTVNVTGVNDAPVSTGFDNVTFTEGANYVQLDTGFNQVLKDPDSPNFDGGTLTVSVTDNKVGTEDRLILLTGGTSLLSGDANGNLSYNNVVIATVSPSGVGLDRVFTFNANATVQAVQTVLRNLAYVNTNQGDPSTETRTIQYVLTDGDGGSTTMTSTVAVAAVNDAPELSDPTDAAVTFTENDVSVALLQGVTLGDIDNPASFAGGTIELTVSGTEGGINLRTGSSFAIVDAGGGVFELIYEGGPNPVVIGTITGFGTTSLEIGSLTADATQALVNDLIDDFTFTIVGDTPQAGDRTVTLTFDDGGNSGSGGALSDSVTQTLTVVAVDDAAVAVDDSVAGHEVNSVSGNLLGNDIDVDGPRPAIVAVNGQAANVGIPIVLPSGALLIVNPDGSYVYNPNHAFDPTPTLGSGAVNTPAEDSFTYELDGGSTATVTLAIAGVDSNDVLYAPAGESTLTGGIGNDTYHVQSNDRVVEAVGGGTDAVYSSTSYALDAGSEVEVLSAADRNATTALDLNGNGFANELFGNAGANVLFGGGGADRLTGFGGNDSYYVDTAADLVFEAAGGGTDVIYATVSYALGAGSEVETLSVGNHNLTTAIDLAGNEFNNNLYGNAGNNVLFGGAGVDVMLGFGGNDSYYVDSSMDYVFEAAGAGYDVIYTSTSYALDANSEIEILSVNNHAATTAIDLIGNNFNNNLYGNAGNNVLYGGGGVDIMLGFGGNDTFYVDNSSDYIYDVAGGGFDIVYTSASYALDAISEIEILSVNNHAATTAIDLSGNDFSNNIYGNNGNNVIFGGGGVDVMLGFGGNDSFYVDNTADYVGESAGGGFDVIYSSVSYTLDINSEVEILSVNNHAATTAINFVGNRFANNLYGNAGANTLDGGAGADVMLGFGGADTFKFTTALGNGNVDVMDFVSGTDKIALDDAIFTGLGLGALSADAFVAGGAALDADDRIIYDRITGNLYFDADGNGAGAAVQFAQVLGAPALVMASDFVVI